MTGVWIISGWTVSVHLNIYVYNPLPLWIWLHTWKMGIHHDGSKRVFWKYIFLRLPLHKRKLSLHNQYLCRQRLYKYNIFNFSVIGPRTPHFIFNVSWALMYWFSWHFQVEADLGYPGGKAKIIHKESDIIMAFAINKVSLFD